MMANIHEAKTHLSRLLQKVLLGEEIIISKAGKPIAKIIPYQELPADRRLGQDQDLFQVPEDFNAELPAEVSEAFEK
jgi:prevent-host-death family protein